MTIAALTGKIALVTGSDSGIGQATAIAFAAAGADVVVTYLHDEAGAEATRAQVSAAGRTALVVKVDVSDEHQVTATFDQAVEQFHTVDILVNNAGVDASGTEVAELSTEVWDMAIRTNLYGAFFCCRRFVQLRKLAGGGGKIINVTSVHEDIPRRRLRLLQGRHPQPHAHAGARAGAAADQRQQPRTGDGAHAVQPEGHRRSGVPRGARPEHPVEAGRRAG